MKDRKRPQYIERQLKEVNDYFHALKVKDHYDNLLFHWWCNYLSKNGWYRGWNVHIDREVEVRGEKTTIRALAGPISEMDEATRRDHYIQIW